MKNIIRNILLEFAEDSSDGLSKLEISILKNLNSRDFTPKTRRSTILSYLNDDLGLSSKESMELYFLFLHNYKTNGDYENLDKIKRTDLDSHSKSIRTSNVTARDLVTHRVPFTGSNTHGGFESGNVYVVRSYRWYPIFVYKDGQWYENSSGYSMSTKKQMSQLRPSKSDTIKLTIDELFNLIHK